VRAIAPLFRTALATLPRCLPGDRRASVSTMLAMATPVLIGFMGLAIDTTYWETAKVSLQGATDQAAIAAGRAYRSDANVTTEAVSVLADHGFVNGTKGVAISVQNPPTSGSYAGNPAAILVSVTQPQASIFASVLGLTPPVVTARAITAPSTSGGGACIIALATSGTGVSMNGTNTVNISHCNVYANSTANNAIALTSNATLTALNAYVTGGWSVNSQVSPCLNAGTTSERGLCVRKSLQTGASPVADPYATRAIPSVPARCDSTNASHSNSASYTAKPDGIWVFCGGLKLTGSGNTLTLGPGIYMIDRDQLSINGDWTINGTGVALFFTSSTGSNHGSLKVQGNQTVNLTAPATGIAKGIAVWMHRSAPTSSTIDFGGGASLAIVGAIYAANAAVTVSGNNGSAKCTQIVARAITFNGNNTFKHDCGGVGISDPPGSLPALVLVQ
jgi:hypothetical protein